MRRVTEGWYVALNITSAYTCAHFNPPTFFSVYFSLPPSVGLESLVELYWILFWSEKCKDIVAAWAMLMWIECWHVGGGASTARPSHGELFLCAFFHTSEEGRCSHPLLLWCKCFFVWKYAAYSILECGSPAMEGLLWRNRFGARPWY